MEDSIHSERADYRWDAGNYPAGAAYEERYDDYLYEAGRDGSVSRYRAGGNKKSPESKLHVSENIAGPDGGGKRTDASRKPDARVIDNRGAAPGGGSRYSNSSTYRVQKGDSLYKISRRFGCSVNELARLNKIGSRGGIRTGMVLRLPSYSKTGIVKGIRESQGSRGTDMEFSWPLRKVLCVERDTGPGARPGGVLIKGTRGDDVLSAADGEVEKIGEMRGYGTYVILSHGGRFISVYARLRDIRVREGDKVASGRSIARVSPDDGTIIFEIGRSGKPVDPLRYLPRKNGLVISSN